MRNKDTDYLHAVARTAYLQSQLVSKGELMKAADAYSAGDAFRLLSGRQIFKDHSIDEYEHALESSLEEAYELVEEITDYSGITSVFRYHTDGHNFKVMVKNRAVDGDFSCLYKNGGTVEINVMKSEFDDKAFYHVPEVLGNAVLEAAEELARTGDSQKVDILIDNGVLALMGEKAAQLGFRCITDYVTAKIDLINFRTALRLMRMKKDTFEASKAFAEGGSFTKMELEEAYSTGFDGLTRLAEKIPQPGKVKEAITLIKQGASIGVFELQADRCFRNLFEEAGAVPFGMEPIVSYLYLKEREVRACRMVLASKLYKLSRDTIRERLGYIYAD